MANTTNTNVSLMDASKFKINTQHFSPYDLSLFVESIETITRLTREKEERKYRKKALTLNNVSKKFITLPRINSVSTLNSSASSGDELLENRKVPQTSGSEGSEYDETYYSAPTSAQSSPRHSAIYQKQLHMKSSSISDSDESGVYAIEPETDTKMITKSKSQSTKHRLLSMVRKKETNNVPTVKLISCRALDEYETLEMYKQEQQLKKLQAELVPEKDKFSRFPTLHMKKKSRLRITCDDGSSFEEHFLNKALRYLTL